MRISNHAPGFGHQWGYPAWVAAEDLSESFWVADTDDEDVSSNADPLLILMAAEEQDMDVDVAISITLSA